MHRWGRWLRAWITIIATWLFSPLPHTLWSQKIQHQCNNNPNHHYEKCSVVVSTSITALWTWKFW